MKSPIELASVLVIGSVDFVSSDQIKVALSIDAPQATALNSGVPSPFPRVNGYVLIPNEGGAVVCVIEWIGIEPSQYPKRTGMRDFGLVDLPYPLRKMSLTPVGTLICSQHDADGNVNHRLERGVFVFPSVGDPVHLPSILQLRAIVEANGPDRRIVIGTAPLAGNAKVTVDPDKLFGRHLAVLGNTGSGKSCTLAGLIRWSLTSAKIACDAAGRQRRPNARFIILDPNGEYGGDTFKGLHVRVFKVNPSTESGASSLVVPAWLWNGHEWSVFAQASPGAQRPMLIRALRELRAGATTDDSWDRRATRRFRMLLLMLKARIADQRFSDFKDKMDYQRDLEATADDAADYAGKCTVKGAQDTLRELATLAASTKKNNLDSKGYVGAISEKQIQAMVDAIEAVLTQLPKLPDVEAVSEDSPIAFDVSELPGYLDALASTMPGQNAQFIANLNMRIRTMLSDSRMSKVVRPPANEQPTLEQWLTTLLGTEAEPAEVVVIDLSFVPSDVLHIIVSVISRLLFEAIQRHRSVSDAELPTVIVLEEAHNFIRRAWRTADGDGTFSPTGLCRETFERIAREGRKFGLGLVLSSQRPDELSPTVLGQCNTFVMHRIVNDQDQELVRRLVPDNLGGLLRDLPSLPSRQAVLLGAATAVPVLVEIAQLPEKQCPKSHNPRFWETWVGERPVSPDWKKVSDDWTS